MRREPMSDDAGEKEVPSAPKLEIVVPEEGSTNVGIPEHPMTAHEMPPEILAAKAKFDALPKEEQERMRKAFENEKRMRASREKVTEERMAAGFPQAPSGPPQPVTVPTPLAAPPSPRTPNRKLILRNGQSPGDGIMLAFAATSLQESYPGLFQVDVRTPYGELFEGMYGNVLTQLNEADPTVVQVDMSYETIHQSNQRPYLYMNGMVHDLALRMTLPIAPTNFQGFLP